LSCLFLSDGIMGRRTQTQFSIKDLEENHGIVLMRA
jgi:hypothetical protein